jgi:regulator of sigma E protease
MDFLIKAAQLLLSLSILVVLHEFGHYLTARYFKIRVEKFYLFFNPWFSLFKKKIGETEWGIGWLPLGGYVKISGMIDESMDKEQMAQPAQPWEFRSKPAWQRLIVMIGGVVVNLLLGIFIYFMVVLAWGEEQIHSEDLTVGMAIHPYLQKYGLESGDNVLEIDGEKVLHPQDVTKGLLVRNQHDLKVLKQDGTTKMIKLHEDIEWELFTEGALPVVGLRHHSTEVHYLTAVLANETLDISEGDMLRAINGIPVKRVDLNDPAISEAKKIEVEISRDGTHLTLPYTQEEFKTFLESFPAFSAGLRYQDKIIAIDGMSVSYFDDIQKGLFNAKKETQLTVLRHSDTLEMTVHMVKDKAVIGFAPVNEEYVDKKAIQTVHFSFGASFGHGIHLGLQTLGDYVGQLKFLFSKKGASSIGGFGAIGSMFPSSWNWQIFWLNTALISIILAFMNILPIPALDGGHVVFLMYEIITGKEAPQKVLEYAQYIGFFLLVGLLLYANGNDIYRWLAG